MGSVFLELVKLCTIIQMANFRMANIILIWIWSDRLRIICLKARVAVVVQGPIQLYCPKLCSFWTQFLIYLSYLSSPSSSPAYLIKIFYF